MNERKPGTFEEKLREVLARYRESQEAYERWLEERGLDRGAIREAARGPGSGEAPVRAERFERLRRDVDRELAREGGRDRASSLGRQGMKEHHHRRRHP
jgi:hypothetical protein